MGSKSIYHYWLENGTGCGVSPSSSLSKLPKPQTVIFSRSLSESLWSSSRIEERTLALVELARKIRRKEVRAGRLSLSLQRLQ